MNRRNLLKSLFALPFFGLLKATPLCTPAKITNIYGDMTLSPSINGSFKLKHALYKQYYNLNKDNTIKELSHTDYQVYRDCGHSEWATSPSVCDPAGIIAETYPHGGIAPAWPGKCLKCCLKEFSENPGVVSQLESKGKQINHDVLNSVVQFT